MSLFASNKDSQHSSTGEVKQDSVLIAYDDLRIVNSKLIELKFEKEINSKLKQTIHNDSIIQANYDVYINKLDKDKTKYKKQRNILGGISLGTIITTLILLIK